MACAIFPVNAATRSPESTPQLRIDGTMHTAMVRVVRYDAVRNRAVTVSLDKTVRIWQLPQWRLVRTLRVPAEGVNEGKLGALSISPDGRRIAVGGWTGWDWEGKSSVYIFDADTGHMEHRITGLDERISYIDFSRDGSLLAVGLEGSGGLHVFHGQKYHFLYADPEYGARIAYVEYASHNNTLATTAYDGHVRLYDPKGKLFVRQRVPHSQSGHLGGVRLSPNGEQMAIGLQDRATAVVIAVPSMKVLAELQTNDVPGQISNCCIAWSRDGRHLFVNGRFEGTGETPLYRWNTSDFTKREIIRAAPQRIQSMYPLQDGSLLYVTEDPAFGVIDAQGQRGRYIEPPVADFRDGRRDFRVSTDARHVSVSLQPGGKAVAWLSVPDLLHGVKNETGNWPGSNLTPSQRQRLQDVGRLVKPAREAGADFQKPTSSGSGGFHFKGHRLPFNDSDLVRSHAVSADGTKLLVGTDHHLVLFDSHGKTLWYRSVPGVAWNVWLSDDARWALATYGDGTVRWHDATTGEERLAWFPHRNAEDWVLWRPDGYYVSSENGDQYVGWHVNRGLDQAADFYRAVQFERVFYRPDLLRSVLDATEAGRPRPTDEGLSAERLRAIQPTRVNIVSAIPSTRPEGTRLALDIEFEDGAFPSKDLGVFVNGIPVLKRDEQKIRQGTGKRRQRLEIPVEPGDNAIRVEIFNGQSMGLAETHFVATTEDMAPKPGDLYLLAVGVDQFPLFSPAARVNLQFAGRDAEEVSKQMKALGAGYFKNVRVRLLGDSSPTPATRHNVLQSLEFLRDAGPQDTVVVFLASHGLSDSAGNYFFVPRDGSPTDVEKIKLGQLGSGQASSLVPWQSLFDAMRSTAGRRLMVVDTCHAQGAVGTFDSHSLKKRSAASSFGLMVASQIDELAQEYSKGGHGLFTYAFLEGLRGLADSNSDGKITIQETFNHVSQRVRVLGSNRISQTPDLIGPDVLRNTVLVQAHTR